MPTPDHVNAFWFSDRVRACWFRSSPQFDAEIATELGPAHDLAAAGQLDGWTSGASSCLALVILLDQVPRNIFRGTPRAFATDARALAAADQAVERGFDQALAPEQRLFLYLPFEHSEQLSLQDRAVELFRLRIGPGEWLDYALKHQDVIRRFGRFPHRNRILGRPSTAAELEFLAQPGSSF